jgi:hypothetical protein
MVFRHRHHDRRQQQPGSRETLVLAELDARQTDDEERGRRQRTNGKARRHLTEQRGLPHLDGRHAERPTSLGDDRQRAEIKGIGVEE